MRGSRRAIAASFPEGFVFSSMPGSTDLIIRSDYKARLADLNVAHLEQLLSGGSASGTVGTIGAVASSDAGSARASTAARGTDGARGRVAGSADNRAGRGRVAWLRFEDGTALVVKKYRRGGLLARVLPDLFPSPARMIADLEASSRARAREIPVAVPVGLILVRRFGWLHAGYLLSEAIEGASTLAEVLARSSPGWQATRLAQEAVRMIRRLHDAGILHRDLNLGNMLVRESEMFVIDLDGASIVESASPAQRFENLSRLDRSYVKTFGDEGPVSHADRRELLATYAASDGALLRDLEALVPRHKRSLALHKVRWRS